MENTNVKEKTIEQKLYDVACAMGELGYAGTTIHEIANILKRNYFEIIPIEPEDKLYFTENYCSMNELINVIWDYSERVKKELDLISDKLMEIRNKMVEEEHQ